MRHRKEYPNCAIKSPERAKEEARMIAAVQKKKTGMKQDKKNIGQKKGKEQQKDKEL